MSCHVNGSARLRLAVAILLLFCVATAVGEPVIVESPWRRSCIDRPFLESIYSEVGMINPTGDPVGGGASYSAAIDANDADFFVSDLNEFVFALLAATSGEIVFLDPAAVFDLTGLADIVIPAGLTLASDRGTNASPGALIRTANPTTLFRVLGDNVRVTGLRLHGPGSDGSDCATAETRGVIVFGDDFEIDNTELTGWSIAAVQLVDAKRAHYHHNYAHNNRVCLGYGIALYGDSDALIEANVFNHNWHSIAGDGSRGQSYEARYNAVQKEITGHPFDMHGRYDYNPEPWAGDQIYIHHNSFLPTDGFSTGVVIRDIPESCAWIENNWFVAEDHQSIQQQNATGNLTAASNLFRTPGLMVSLSGQSDWIGLQPMNVGLDDVHFGDFDGDGRDDAFRSANGGWYVAAAADGIWRRINSSNVPISSLRFADFNGDDRQDVFYKSGSAWKVSYGGETLWQDLQSSGVPLSELRFGDFNGDGRADVFTILDNAWRVSFGGTGLWTSINQLSADIEELRFGDFNGDGRTDVFRTGAGSWWISYGGISGWSRANNSAYTVDRLRFADINGDDRTDVVVIDAGSIRWSSGATTTWQELVGLPGDVGTGDVTLADLNGDGEDDIVYNGLP